MTLTEGPGQRAILTTTVDQDVRTLPTATGAVAGVMPGTETEVGAEPAMLLLVEDDPEDAMIVEDMLAESGVTTPLRWARTLTEARRLIDAEGQPDCVLLDLNLGETHGLRVLRQMIPMAPDAAVVVLTGLAEHQAGLAAVAAGAQDFLSKSDLQPQSLARVVRYAVQRKHVEHAAAQLQAGRLRAEENARLERGLLPRPLIATADVQIAARYRSGSGQSLLGGDFYDVVETPDGAVHAVIGDVCGHGPAEAALGVCLRVAWRSFVLAGITGPQVLRLMERLLLSERGDHETFATLTTLTLTPDRTGVDVVRAGHPGFIVREAGNVRLAEPAAGIALGLLPDMAQWQQQRLDLTDGSALVLFTDGLFEGRTDTSRERLDLDGLLGLAQNHAHLDADDFVDGLIAEAERLSAPYGGLDDDIAVLHIGWRWPRA